MPTKPHAEPDSSRSERCTADDVECDRCLVDCDAPVIQVVVKRPGVVDYLSGEAQGHSSQAETYRQASRTDAEQGNWSSRKIALRSGNRDRLGHFNS